MTELKLKQLVSEAVALDRHIREQEARLKELKAALTAEAESRADEHTPTVGGGSAIAFTGDAGVARITFPGQRLKEKIDGEGKTIEKVKAACGGHFVHLFTPAITYRLVPEFRERAALLLGKDAAKLVKLCQTESSPRVSFETKGEEA